MLSGDVPKLLAGDPVDEVRARVVRPRRHLGPRPLDPLAAGGRPRTWPPAPPRAEQDRAAHAARAVADERARIARELHDLVAHSMGVIVIQSQAGQRAIDADPDAARAALASIESSGRQGLAEMRRLLGLLTSPEDGSVSPQPGLRDLPDLVDRVRDGRRPGRRPSVGRRADRAARRRRPRRLPDRAGGADERAQARRPGRPPPWSCGRPGERSRSRCATTVGARTVPRRRGGHGLVGMRERAALYGGTVEAGNLPGGGYRVRARLLVDGRRGDASGCWSSTTRSWCAPGCG